MVPASANRGPALRNHITLCSFPLMKKRPSCPYLMFLLTSFALHVALLVPSWFSFYLLFIYFFACPFFLACPHQSTL
jgi:hypothetical protein